MILQISGFICRWSLIGSAGQTDGGGDMTVNETIVDGKFDRHSRLTIIFVVLALFAALAGVTTSTAPTATTDPAAVWATAGWDDSSALGDVDFTDYPGSLYAVTRSIDADNAWSSGYTGFGIDVAVIDTGVAPVPMMSPDWKLINGPDLSFESQSPDHEYLDSYGHGTHIAGIIAGRDPAAPNNLWEVSKDYFLGVAPDSRIVNMKVGTYNGAVDVSQVIAAIDWVIQHRYDQGMNIQVINLAYGTLPQQSYEVDPLAQAVEKAWKAGIVVVVAAGNDGNDAPLRNPAYDPYVISVGSAQHGDYNTASNALVSYDRVSAFSNCGIARTVDLVAPGKSITSLRVPGSYADDNFPQARVGSEYFLGSGTSQAAAVVSGAAAVLLSRDWALTPDEVKALLMAEAKAISGVSDACQGAGVVDLGFLGSRRLPNVNGTQSYALSDGSGLLELSRGGEHLEMEGVLLEGEQDIMGNPWIGFNEVVTECWKEGRGRNAETVCEEVLVATDTLWNGGDWNGTSWSGTSWSGTSWSGTSWSGTSWSGTSWSGTSWSDKTWNGTSWSGTSWSGTSWSGTSWSGRNWTGLSWGRTARAL
jgi:serine protease AprX